VAAFFLEPLDALARVRLCGVALLAGEVPDMREQRLLAVGTDEPGALSGAPGQVLANVYRLDRLQRPRRVVEELEQVGELAAVVLLRARRLLRHDLGHVALADPAEGGGGRRR